MKVIKIDSLRGTDREKSLDVDGFSSIRPILECDGVGFSVCKTIIPKGKARIWHYKRHYEACYCISGTGLLKNLDNGDEWQIRPDVIYILDNHDRHSFQALEDVVLISVFNPPLIGNEQHAKDGSY